MYQVKYSQWIDSEDINIISVQNRIQKEAKRKAHNLDKDPFDNGDLKNDVQFKFDTLQTLTLAKKQIKYNYIIFNYEVVNPFHQQDTERSKRVTLNEYEIVLFEVDGVIKYIVNKNNSNTIKTVLRKLNGLGNKSQTAIMPANLLGIKSDLFVWLVHNLIENPEKKIGTNYNIKIDTITSFRGEKPTMKESPKNNTITGHGETIMNMVTTLLFLFESKSISVVELHMFIDDDQLTIQLTKGGGVALNLNNFIYGPSKNSNVYQQNSEKLIFIFYYLLQQLVDSLSDEQSTRAWSDKKIQMFYKRIGRSIKQRVTEMMKSKI